MTTFSTLMLFAVVGQVGGGSDFGSANQVPQSSARRTLDTPPIPSSRFGAPTPAQPTLADSAPAANSRSVLTSPQASDLNVISNSNNFTPNGSSNSQGRNVQFNTAPTSNSAPQINTAPQNNFQTRATLATSQDNAENTAAMRLVRQSFPSPEDAGDETTQLPLRDVIAVTNDRTRRIAAIGVYWEAATLLADWQFASEEYDVIRQLSASRDTSQQSTLAAAQTAAQARLIEAQMAASSARFALGEILPARRNSDKPLLPIDTPLVGEYNTQFDTLFAARVPPPGLRRIHEILPLRQDLVEARAAAVIAATDSLEQQVGQFRNGRASLSDVLRTMENLRTQRGAFLGALRDYNLDIAEYALGTSLPNDTPDKVVAMMIKAPSGATNASHLTPSGSGRIAPAGATAPMVNSIGLPPSQLTPAEGSATQLPPPQSQPSSQGAIFVPSGTAPTISAPPNGNSVLGNPRVADQSGAAASDVSRPTTERVLGTLRDVTNQTPTTILQPTTGNGISPTQPSPPTTGSQFGGTQFQANPSDAAPPPSSRFGGSQFGNGQPTNNQPTGAAIDNATIVTPTQNAPVLPPLTP